MALLNVNTVSDDRARDRIFGGGGRDAFFSCAGNDASSDIVFDLLPTAFTLDTTWQ